MIILLNDDDHVKPLLILNLCVLNGGSEYDPYSRNLGENFEVMLTKSYVY
jgi:hypothetical protein